MLRLPLSSASFSPLPENWQYGLYPPDRIVTEDCSGDSDLPKKKHQNYLIANSKRKQPDLPSSSSPSQVQSHTCYQNE